MKIEGSVPRIVSPSKADFIQNFMLPQTPVVISGATKHWRALTEWTPEYLRTRLGDCRVRVKESVSKIYPDVYSATPTRHVDSTLGEYIDLIVSDDPARRHRYLSGDEIQILADYTRNNPALALLSQDFDVPNYFDREQLKTIGFWISADGLVASLHYDSDGSHNLNVQVKGKKRVLVFSPRQFMHPVSGIKPSFGSFNFSQANIEAPDEQRFPGLRTARCSEAIIEEGDMLYIPSYWYHAVYHLGRININVNFWWQPREYALTKTSFRAIFLKLLYSALTNGNPVPNLQQVKVALEALSPETTSLLQRMEELVAQQYQI
jgi:oxalate decarboxylase/phosphoglucose isomerase-like protein (cupin superfamily)